MNHASEHSFLQSAAEGWSLDAQNLEIQASSAQLPLSQQHSNITSDSLVSQSVAEAQLDCSTEKEKTLSQLQRRLVVISQSSSGATFAQDDVPQESSPETSSQAVEKYVSAMAAMSLNPKYTGLCGTVLCYAMNPANGSMVQIRALLDSGANLTMINRSVAKAIGLTGREVSISLNVTGGGTFNSIETEVVFSLVRKDKTHVTQPIVGLTTESVGNPFGPVDFKPKRYEHLKDIEFADKFPAPRERPFQLLLSEPYFLQLEKEERRVPEDPALPVAVNTELGWVLRGALGIEFQVEQASAFGALATDHESFDLETMYKSLGFDFSKLWSGENVGIQANESMTSDWTALEIQAEEFQKQTATYDAEKRQWSVELPWINGDLESHRLTENSCLLYTSPSPRDS